MPVTDVVEPQGVLLEDFLLLGSSMGPEREAAPTISRPGSRRRDDLPIVVPNPREKLPAGLALIEPSLPVRVEHRKRLGPDAYRNPLHLERQSRAAHENVHSPS